MQHDGQLAAIGDAELGQLLDFPGFDLVVALQAIVFLDQGVLLERQRDRHAQIVVIPRLEDELVDCATLHRPDHGIHVGMTGHHDAYRVGTQGACLFQQFAAVHAGHHVIADYQVERIAIQERQRLLRVLASHQLVIFLAEYAAQG